MKVPSKLHGKLQEFSCVKVLVVREEIKFWGSPKSIGKDIISTRDRETCPLTFCVALKFALPCWYRGKNTVSIQVWSQVISFSVFIFSSCSPENQTAVYDVRAGLGAKMHFKFHKMPVKLNMKGCQKTSEVFSLHFILFNPWVIE